LAFEEEAGTREEEFGFTLSSRVMVFLNSLKSPGVNIVDSRGGSFAGSIHGFFM
jgi:hypothetical protein